MDISITRSLEDTRKSIHRNGYGENEFLVFENEGLAQAVATRQNLIPVAEYILSISEIFREFHEEWDDAGSLPDEDEEKDLFDNIDRDDVMEALVQNGWSTIAAMIEACSMYNPDYPVPAQIVEVCRRAEVPFDINTMSLRGFSGDDIEDIWFSLPRYHRYHLVLKDIRENPEHICTWQRDVDDFLYRHFEDVFGFSEPGGGEFGRNDIPDFLSALTPEELAKWYIVSQDRDGVAVPDIEYVT